LSTRDPYLSAISHATGEDSLVVELVHVALRDARVDAVDLMLIDRDDVVLRASSIAPQYSNLLRMHHTLGWSGHVERSRRRLVIPDRASEDPGSQSYKGFDESAFPSAVIEPLFLGSNYQGCLILRRRTPGKPTPVELRHGAAVAQRVIASLEAYRGAYAAGTQGARRLGAVSEVTDIISRSPYLEEILQLLVNMTAQQFAYRVCTVRLLDENNEELVLRATQAIVKAYQRKRAIRLGESIAGRVIVEKRTMVVDDVQTDPEYIGHDLAVEQGLRSMVCVPLLIQDRAVGVMTCYTGEVRRFEDDEIKALETIATQAAASIEHAKLQVRHTLMQEMHHRVKNNLQQVVSLLRLQTRAKSGKSTTEVLNDSIARILAIAAVHDLLSREDLDHVGVRSVAEALVHHQQQSFIAPGKQIYFQVKGDDIHLNMTQATQLALVLNELILNAVEHGFKIADRGDVHVNVEVEGDEVGVWVSNNGDPLPPGFSVGTAQSLGLQIVQNLARALGGQFVMEDRLGWTVTELLFTRHTSE
jgi:two-component sensor histidine kinase